VRRRARVSVLALAALVLLVLAMAGAAHADRRDEAWRRGNEAYLHGDYAAAAAAYEELEHQGVVSADLFFNLGDAYFRKGAPGPAIWAFEKAAALNPSDEDARYNLGEARKLAARAAHDRIEGEDRDPLWIRAVTAVGPST
jgi:tetratricopeptide (TPR) repeat protein